MAYASNFDKLTYTQISKLFAAGTPEENTKWQKATSKAFGNDYILWKLALLEDQFIGACVCYNRLKTRSEEYLTLSDLLSPGDLISNPIIKELHAYEYFFFTCCGYIYKELLSMQKVSEGKFQVDLSDLVQLKDLNEERRVHEHGKEWFWGENDSRKVPSKGDNHNFEKNMQLLDKIYTQILEQLIKVG